MDTSAVQKEASPDTLVRPKISWYARPYVLVSFIVALTWTLMAVGLPQMGADILIDPLQALVILLAGSLPAVIYTYFIVGRLPILDKEYRQNLRRLGFPESSSLYREKFSAVYGATITRPSDIRLADTRNEPQLQTFGWFQSPILIATVLSLLGWILVFYPPDVTPSALIPNAKPLVYGFLGAYVFAIGALVRQFVTDDLQPRYYANLTARYITVFVLCWLIALLVPKAIGTTTIEQSYLIAAFTIGLFPSIGLRVAQRIGTKALGIFVKGFSEKDELNELDGLNAYDEDRLLIEGIENQQNLACANIVDLMLRTRFPVEQLVDWMDQALLHLHARDRITDFHKVGIRTVTDFLDAYVPPGVLGKDLEDRQKHLADLLDHHTSSTMATSGVTAPAAAGTTAAGPTTGAGLTKTGVWLQTIAATLRVDPNLFHIRYWREHPYEALPEDVESSRTQADLKIMAGLPEEAIPLYTELLRSSPEYHTAHLYRGTAYYTLRMFEWAVNDYDVVINDIKQRGTGWESARYAFLWKGRALWQMGRYEESLAIFKYGLDKIQSFPEASYDLGFFQMSDVLKQYDEAIANFETAIKAKFNVAESRANLGWALYASWRQKKLGTVDLSELDKAKANLESAINMKPDLLQAYVNLAAVYEESGDQGSAIRILSDALSSRKPSTIRTLPDALVQVEELADLRNRFAALAKRGHLYRKAEKYQAAATDYQAAIKLVPNDAAAYFDLAKVLQAYSLQQPAQRAQAIEALRTTIGLDPHHIGAHQLLGDMLADRWPAPLAQPSNELPDEIREAIQQYSEALRLARAGKYHSSEMQAHLGLGSLFRRWDLLQDAERELRQTKKLGEELVPQPPEDTPIYTRGLYELGLLYLQTQQIDSGIQMLRDSAALFATLDDLHRSIESNIELARACLDQNEPGSLSPMLSEAERALEQAQQDLSVIFNPQNELDRQLEAKIADERQRLAKLKSAPPDGT